MNRIISRMTVLGFASALLVTGACGNTADGVKKDSQEAGEKAAEATANAGNAMDAGMNTADVKTALLADTRIHATDINVDTNKDTKTVTLNGTVQADSEKVLAADVARSKAPEYTVVNNLTIKKP